MIPAGGFFFNFILIPPSVHIHFPHTVYTQPKNEKESFMLPSGGWRVNLTCASIIHMHGP